MEGDALELFFDDQSCLSKHPVAIESFRLANHRAAHRPATQRGRHALAELPVGDSPRGIDRCAGRSFRSRMGGRACSLAYCHPSVAPAIRHGSAWLRAGCAVDTAWLSFRRQCLEQGKMGMVDSVCAGEFRSSLHLAADLVHGSDFEPFRRRWSLHGEAILTRAQRADSPMAGFGNLRGDRVPAVVPAVRAGSLRILAKRARF